jgi:hypothetical protein
MPWKKGESGNPQGRTTEKMFTEALRMAVLEDDHITGKRKMRLIAEKLCEKALGGDCWAIAYIGDRLDGKPAQESTVTIDNKRDGTDWSRHELVAVLNDAKAGSNGAAKANGRGDGPDSVH